MKAKLYNTETHTHTSQLDKLNRDQYVNMKSINLLNPPVTNKTKTKTKQQARAPKNNHHYQNMEIRGPLLPQCKQSTASPYF